VTILATLLDPAVMLGGGGGTTVLGFIGAQLHRQGKEIKECRERDARFVVIEAGFRMVVGEMARTNPNSPALQMCADLLNRKLGPAPVDVDGFADLLRKLDEIPETKGKKGTDE
jgi:hypothetical protein